LLIILSTNVSIAFAAGQSSANYSIPRDTLNSAGGEMVSANYRMNSAVGDAVSTGSITSVAYRLDNGFLAQVSVSPGVLTLLTVISQKLHGATPFNLTLYDSQSVSGNISIEPRSSGAGHTLIFHFDAPITSAGAATALSGLANAGTASVSLPGNGDVRVTLTNVTDGKVLTVNLTGLNGSGSASATMAFLYGDVSRSGKVTGADISAVKASQGRALNANPTTFLFDINLDGTINLNDVRAVKAQAGREAH
jgi:hypothetical protein